MPIELKKNERICPVCKGAKLVKCPICKGVTGTREVLGGIGYYSRPVITCGQCGGQGEVKCCFCDGAGKVTRLYDFVWQYACSHRTAKDKDPMDALTKDFGGDRGWFIRDMAKLFNIKFCGACEKPEQDCRAGLRQNVENKGVDLCEDCVVEYLNWRPDNAPVEPDVQKFVRWKKFGYPY